MGVSNLRKIKLFIASSLDGHIASENGGIDWLFSDADYGYSSFYDSIDTVLVGRKTYDKALEFEKYPFKGKKVYVFTQRLADKSGDVEFASDAAKIAKRLSESQGKDIWLVGGSEIVTALLNAGLIDEIILSIHPIVLGRGIALFNNIQKQCKMTLIKSTAFESGLVQLHYKVLRDT